MRNAILPICALAMLSAVARGAAQSPVVLRGKAISVEAESRNGGLRERYLAARDGVWVEVAVGDQGRTVGPVSVMTGADQSFPGKVRDISLKDGSLVEELTAGEHRIVRTLTIVGDGSWIRVLKPSGDALLYRFCDQFKVSDKPDWAFSPSVGGFDPDAQYKAPLILTQGGA